MRLASVGGTTLCLSCVRRMMMSTWVVLERHHVRERRRIGARAATGAGMHPTSFITSTNGNHIALGRRQHMWNMLEQVAGRDRVKVHSRSKRPARARAWRQAPGGMSSGKTDAGLLVIGSQVARPDAAGDVEVSRCRVVMSRGRPARGRRSLTPQRARRVARDAVRTIFCRTIPEAGQRARSSRGLA